jgi:hypothetical protein
VAHTLARADDPSWQQRAQSAASTRPCSRARVPEPARGDTSVTSGVLDDDAVRTIVRRVNLLGGRVWAIFRELRRAPRDA